VTGDERTPSAAGDQPDLSASLLGAATGDEPLPDAPERRRGANTLIGCASGPVEITPAVAVQFARGVLDALQGTIAHLVGRRDGIAVAELNVEIEARAAVLLARENEVRALPCKLLAEGLANLTAAAAAGPAGRA
jgi:hypothetical protein